LRSEIGFGGYLGGVSKIVLLDTIRKYVVTKSLTLEGFSKLEF